MKRFISLRALVCGLALALFCAVLPGAAQAEGQYAMVRGGNLHLRADHSADSRSLGLYPSGTWVEVINSGSAWCYVRTDNDKIGYMATNYLTLDSTSTMASGTVRNPNGYVNLRASASMSGTVLGRYQPGTQVEVLTVLSSGWTQVRVGGVTGYMVSEFVYLDQSIRTGTTVTKYGGRINLRAGPLSDARIVTSVPTGTSVSVLIQGKSWHKVSMSGYTGYIAAQYISFTDSGSSATGTSAVVKNPRSTQVLNLRARPSADAQVLGYYKNGTQVSVVTRGDTWCEVYVGTKHGYMMTRYLDFGAGTGTTATLYNPNGGSVVNMRAGATLQSAIVGIYPVGTQATVHRRGTDWAYVTIGAQTGYVSVYFLR